MEDCHSNSSDNPELNNATKYLYEYLLLNLPSKYPIPESELIAEARTEHLPIFEEAFGIAKLSLKANYGMDIIPVRPENNAEICFIALPDPSKYSAANVCKDVNREMTLLFVVLVHIKYKKTPVFESGLWKYFEKNVVKCGSGSYSFGLPSDRDLVAIKFVAQHYINRAPAFNPLTREMEYVLSRGLRSEIEFEGAHPLRQKLSEEVIIKT